MREPPCGRPDHWCRPLQIKNAPPLPAGVTAVWHLTPRLAVLGGAVGWLDGSILKRSYVCLDCGHAAAELAELLKHRRRHLSRWRRLAAAVVRLVSGEW